MPKNQVKVKKSDGGNISITIENNLKANQNVVQPKPERRRRRQPKDLTNNKIDEMLRGGGGTGPLPPLKDVSYIKPPGNSFNVWRDTIDSFNTTIPINQAQQLGLITAPPPPAPPPAPPANNTFNIGNSLPERGVSDGPSWRDFSMFMAGMTPNRGMQPPRNFSNMFDDGLDDENALERAFPPPSAPFAPPPPYVPPAPSAQPEEQIIPESVINQIPGITEAQQREIRDKNTKIQAKRQGTMHARKNLPQNGPYKDMIEYKEAYENEMVDKRTKEQIKEKVITIQKKRFFEQGKKDAEKGKSPKDFNNEEYMNGYNTFIFNLIDLFPNALDQEAGMDPPAAGA